MVKCDECGRDARAIALGGEWGVEGWAWPRNR